MGCAQSTTGTKEMEFKGGILAGHAYGVTDIREIGPHKLLRIRNPWGRKEWTGDWGDEDDEWEKFPDVAKAVGFTPGNDGTFWMAFHDFVKYYNTLYVCRLFPESWEVHCVKSEWKGPTAGGCPAFPTWTKNPMFTLSIERPCVGFVVLSQRDARMEKTGEDWNKYDHPIAFFVVTKSSFEASKGKFNKLEIVGKGLPFRPDRELSLSVSIRLQPEKGPFIIIPTTHKAGQQGPFFLNVYTSDKAKLEGGEPMEPPSVGDGDDSDSDEGEGEDFEPKAAEEPEKDKKLEKLEKGGDEMDEESIIEMCKAKRCKYEDPHFPADASSLFREADKKPSWHMPPERVKWLRPEEFCPEEPKLFVEGVEPGDVIQGALGDCWFLGALSTVATKQEKLQNLFTNAAKYRKDYGVVTLRFYKNGKWKEVVIDDRIPCMNNKPLYARCKDPNEIWVLLVEKAYAKLHHSYEQLVAGSLSYGLKDLTGGVPQVIKLTDRATKQMIETGMLWKKLIQYHKTDSLMGCAMSTKGTKEMEIADGILAGHAYGITDIREVEGHKLLRVRNPWGKKEWTGDWSDDSEMWEKYPKVKKTLGHTSANDGTFWICWKDFQKSYNKIDICRIFPPEWQETRKKGKWIGESAAGCCMFPSWLKNPQFKVKVKKDEVSTVFISLSQKDARMQKNKRWNEYDHPVGFVVVREEDVVKSKNVKMNKMIAMGLPFAMDREISLSSAIQLDGNQGPFLIIPMTHKPKQEGDFILSIYSSKHISVVGGEAVKFDPAKRDDDDDSDDDEEAAKEMDQTTKESSDEDSGAEV
uniref:Calpain catalytic domain-containing protein n=1 Tax=Palpitomonas bilix TaxID=652834 RepID=A0A7S3D477_9EUKA